MKKNYLVNLDYESYLFDPNYHENSDQYLKINREFEYVFLPFAKTSDELITHCMFSNNDLDRYHEFGFEIPKMVLRKKQNVQNEIIYWWANKYNKELEIHLNSKLTSVDLAKMLGYGFENGTKVYTGQDIKNHINQFPRIENWILKNPFGMSGKGHYLFSKNQLVPEHIVKSRVLLEPLYKRVLDLGTTYELENGQIKNKFHVINFNNHIGQFKGAATSLKPQFWSNLFENVLKIDSEKVEYILDLIADHYLKMSPQNNIQIDSFFYLNDEFKIEFYPLVEVNCRKTMGLVVNELAKKKPDLFCEWHLQPKDQAHHLVNSSIEHFNFGPSHVSHESNIFYSREPILLLNSDRLDGFFFQQK